MKIYYLLLLSVSFFCVGCASQLNPSIDGLKITNNKIEKRDLIIAGDFSLDFYEDITSISNSITQQITEKKGYLTYSSKHSNNTIYLNFSVPQSEFYTIVESLEATGAVNSRSITTKNVTSELVDWNAQMESSIQLRDRIRKLIEKATVIDDLLKLEKELGRIQSEIDRTTAQYNSLKNSVDYSNLNITISQNSLKGPLGWVFYGLYKTGKFLFVID